jgi:hypothetical protein
MNERVFDATYSNLMENCEAINYAFEILFVNVHKMIEILQISNFCVFVDFEWLYQVLFFELFVLASTFRMSSNVSLQFPITLGYILYAIEKPILAFLSL